MHALRDRLRAARRHRAELARERQQRTEQQRRLTEGLANGRAALARHVAGAILTDVERVHLNFLAIYTSNPREIDAAYRAELAIRGREIRAAFPSAPAPAPTPTPAHVANQHIPAIPFPPGFVLSHVLSITVHDHDIARIRSLEDSERRSRPDRPVQPGIQPRSHSESPRRRLPPM